VKTGVGKLEVGYHSTNYPHTEFCVILQGIFFPYFREFLIGSGRKGREKRSSLVKAQQGVELRGNLLGSNILVQNIQQY